MTRSLGLAVLGFASLLASGCGSEGPAASATNARHAKPVVAVVSYPLLYFVERIAGERVETYFPVPAGEDPAFWRPTDDEVLRYQHADRVLLNGATFAKWALITSLPEDRVTDTSKSVADHYIQMKHVIIHSHGPEGPHEHRGTAITTWLDPTIAIVQAQATKDALEALLPETARPDLDRGLASLEKDLHDLDAAFRAAVDQDPKRPVFFSHPVFQYLIHRYAIDAEAVHWEANEMPDEKEWTGFEALLENHPAKWMLWESAPRDDVRERLRELGVESVVFDPCSNRPAEGDFLSVMRADADALRTAFGAGS